MTKVLVVDDSNSIRDMVSFTLKSAGYQTVEAKDGQDGGGDYYRGTGTYKHTFKLDEQFKDKKIYI